MWLGGKDVLLSGHIADLKMIHEGEDRVVDERKIVTLYCLSSLLVFGLSGWSGLLAVIRVERALSQNWTAVIHFAATPPLS